MNAFIERQAIELYINQKKGLITVRKILGISEKELKQCLIANGYHIRTHHEAIIARNQSLNLLKNHDYFSKESHNMAWLLGFIAADGCIEKNRNVIKISLSNKDREILERIRKEINLESPVKDYITKEKHNLSKLQWSSEKHKQDLKKYNIIPQKTFELKPPYQLDKKYWSDYIRGYWDGDGSITIYPNNYNSLMWQITSATKEILEFVIDYFYEEFNIQKVKPHSFIRDGHELYILQYSTKASEKIYSILYQHPNALFLKRKKEQYASYIAIRNNS